MADKQPTAERQITGDDIISEVIRNCDAGAFTMRYTTVLPAVYRVYLHPADFDFIRPIIPALTAETRSALIERMEQLSAEVKPSPIARTLGFDSGKHMEYKILDPDWTVEFHADLDEKLARGDIEVYSELASAPRPEFDGAKTRHVTRRRASGEFSSSQVTQPAAAPPDTASAFAQIRYDADEGPQSFAVTKNQVVVGRGGKAFYVDLKLSGPPDVSREHCRIRRDPATGKFYIKDVSQYGTSIDGKRVPSSMVDGADKNIEVPLPAQCTLNLADVIDLRFEAAS
jgi:hypothetical protein